LWSLGNNRRPPGRCETAMLSTILKYKFWILAILALIPPVVLFIVLVRPLTVQNIADQNKFKGRIEKLEAIAKKRELWNQSYLTAIEDRMKVLIEEETKARNLLLTWQQPLDLVLTRPDDGKEITDAGEWGPRYDAECKAVDAEFLRAGIEKSGEKGLYEYKSFPNKLPSPDERLAATQDVVLYRHFTEMLLRANDEGKKRRILRIVSLQFSDRIDESRLSPAYFTNFAGKSFAMSIVMQYVNLPDALKAFLTSSNLIVVIDGISISRATSGVVESSRKASGRPDGIPIAAADATTASGATDVAAGAGEEIDDLVRVDLSGHIVKYKPGGAAVADAGPTMSQQPPAPGAPPRPKPPGPTKPQSGKKIKATFGKKRDKE